MINFNEFYRKYGLMMNSRLKSPKPLEIRELPKNTNIHFLPVPGEPFLDLSNPYLQKFSLKPIVYTVLNLAEGHHAISVVKRPKELEFRKWVNKNKKRIMLSNRPYATQTNETQLILFNYGQMQEGFKYQQGSKMQRWFQETDPYVSFWKHVGEVANVSMRNNIIFIEIGEGIPSLTALRMATKVGITPREIAIFTNFWKRFILDFWQFAEPSTREKSMLGHIPVSRLNKVTLFFKFRDGKGVLLNLGFFNSWIKGQENQSFLSSINQLDSQKVQLDSLKFFLRLFQINSFGDDESAVEEDQQEQEIQESFFQEEEEDPQDDGPSILDSLHKTIEKKSEAEAFKDEEQDLEEELKLIEKQEEEGLIGQDFSDKLVEDKIAEADIDRTDQDSEGDLDVTPEDPELDTYDVTEGADLTTIYDRFLNPKALGYSTQTHIEDLLAKKAISTADYRKINKQISEMMTIKNPFTNTGKIVDDMVVTEQDVQFDENRKSLVDPINITNESFRGSTVEELDRGYLSKVFKKDIMACMMGVTNMKVMIEDLKTEEEETAEGRYLSITMSVKPIGGKPSTLKHKIPMPDLDGTFKAKGIRYHSRKQVADIPYRKVRGDEVALSTFVSKIFVSRSRAKANNSTEWILKKLANAETDGRKDISRVRPANVYDQYFDAPYTYSTLSEHLKSFDYTHEVFGKVTLDFESRKRYQLLEGSKYNLEELEGKDYVVCGKTHKGLPIVTDKKKNEFHVVVGKGELEPLGNIYKLLNLEQSESPIDFAEINILGKSVPVGLILGRQMGFRNLLKASRVKYRMEVGKNVRTKPDEFKVRFADRSFIFDRSDMVACMLFGGLSKMHKSTKTYVAEEYDKPTVYNVIGEGLGLTQMHLREMDNLSDGFVDPISLRRLKSLGGPLTFEAMLLQSVVDLTTNTSPETQDTDMQQIMGYERFAGAMYREMYKSIRQFRNKNITGRSKIDMSHYQVWQAIMEDSTIKTCEDINPINNLKMHEALTYGGEGGRSRETFNLPARVFNIKAVGVHSEASVDSGDVGYNLYLPWNPNLSSINGFRNSNEKMSYKSGNVLSTSLNLYASVNQNDMKRNGFTSIQNVHTVACAGYEPARIQTGVEGLIGQRTSDLFCKAAAQDGKITKLTKTGLTITYKDGTKEGMRLGRCYGDAEGSTYPHDLITNLKLGDTVKKGETVTYNKDFFTPNPLSPKHSLVKFFTYGNVAFMEVPETHEDSSSLRPHFAEKLLSKKTDPRSYIVRFGQSVHSVLEPGSPVTPDTVLMVIEDEITSGSNVFDKETTSTLARLSRNAPRAGHAGYLDRIEVYYHGDKQDMSKSIRKLADASDERMSNQSTSIDKKTITGKVSADWSVKGQPLALDTCEIVFYITSEKEMGNADKLVFSEQLKSTVGKIETRAIHTESGREVDAIFGGRSVINRITLSVIANGSTMAIMDDCKKRVLEAYF